MKTVEENASQMPCHFSCNSISMEDNATIINTIRELTTNTNTNTITNTNDNRKNLINILPDTSLDSKQTRSENVEESLQFYTINKKITQFYKYLTAIRCFHQFNISNIEFQ